MPNNVTCFLSYAREDATVARELYEQLTSAGANVWYDEESLKPGERWESAIRRGIRSCRYFLALLSSRAISKKGFVQKEIREALEILSEYPDDQIYLIPLRVDDCAPSHDRLRELNWVDLFPDAKQGIVKLLRFLNLSTAPAPTTNAVHPTNPENVSSYALLRFDGLYQSDKRSGYWKYLRFYDDGLVLSVSSTGGDPTVIATWFARNTKRPYASGTYSLSGRNIRFSATSEAGVVDYEGELQGDRIILRHYSHINSNRGVAEYQFRNVRSPSKQKA